MRLKIYLRTLLVVLVGLIALSLSSLTAKAQGDSNSIPRDSVRVLAPIPGLDYTNMHTTVVALVEDVIILRNNQRYLTEINGIEITSPVWGVNLKTGKFLFDKGIKTNPASGPLLSSTKDLNVFYAMDNDRHRIYRVKVFQDTIVYKTIYDNNGKELINEVMIDDGDILYIAESWKGVKILKDEVVVDSINFTLDVYSLYRKNDEIYFGGANGVVGSINIGTNEITNLQNNMGWFGQVFVHNVNGDLYAIGDVDENYLFKFNFENNSWNKVSESTVDPSSLQYDLMYNKYVISVNHIKGLAFFQNDSFEAIPEHPYLLVEAPEKFRMAQWDRYDNPIGRMSLDSRSIFDLKGKTYGIGWGIIGEYRMVPVEIEDTLGGVSVKELNLESVSLYPNPANNIVNISNLLTEAEVSVYDVKGHLVLLQKTSESVDISTLAPGLYFLNIEGYMPTKFMKM